MREGDQDVADLLRGNAALLDAAKKGNLQRVQRLVTPENINCRDAQGRNSTPLHLAGKGYFEIHKILYVVIVVLRGFFFFVHSWVQQRRSSRVPFRKWSRCQRTR